MANPHETARRIIEYSVVFYSHRYEEGCVRFLLFRVPRAEERMVESVKMMGDDSPENRRTAEIRGGGHF